MTLLKFMGQIDTLCQFDPFYFSAVLTEANISCYTVNWG